jgi:glycine dehydrogenase
MAPEPRSPARTFADRHIGPRPADLDAMLAGLGLEHLDDLVEVAVPASIRTEEPLDLPAAASEAAVIGRLRELAAANVVRTSLIGMGYHGTHTPAVVRRNVLEDPSWYTAYTPYQPEISQGRLEALLNFQTMVADLTGTDVANASLLDEATAAAEAMTLPGRSTKVPGGAFFVDAGCHPQTIDVVRDPGRAARDRGGRRRPHRRPRPGGVLRGAAAAPEHHRRGPGPLPHHRGASTLRAASWPSPPTCWRAASSSRRASRVPTSWSARRSASACPWASAVPMPGSWPPREGLRRSCPAGWSGCRWTPPADRRTRLALQTREQHIRREKATSNICTAQVLLAVMASMYAVYHGPEGLRAIALDVHRRTARLARSLAAAGIEVPERFFDTLTVGVPDDAAAVHRRAGELGLNLRALDDGRVGVSLDETTTDDVLARVCQAFGAGLATEPDDGHGDGHGDGEELPGIPAPLRRTSAYLEHPTFAAHRSETEMLRYLRRLADRDVALDRAMIPLGSCTMKLNATTEMEAITWPEWAELHPFAPLEQARGYRELIGELERWLCEVTGYDAVSLQPNAGSQGELAGLLAIRGWHRSRGEDGRDVCLIPSSAHGTNAASAVMAGMRVVVVACDGAGNVDVDDLKAKVVEHGDRLSALMVTYPSTHGVFEARIGEVCDLVHEHGGQVYIDGANLNALVGVARPGWFGGDVSHLNLHKTFCIPHGGGGPGVGPVAAREHLAPFLPNHPLVPEAGPATGPGPISAAPWGSASILPISWAYIALMGPDGLRRATEVAILGANHVARRLGDAYPILYAGEGGWVAHECILDLRPLTRASGVTVDDVAKRLIDYGFHAPTMSFPVAGTLMVEPTESESLEELDRFCDAMLAIREEIAAIESGDVPVEASALRNAPHTAEDLLAAEWDRPYTREEAAYPAGVDRASKYWPPVSRIDGAYGDRNLVCACPPIEDLAEP